MSQPFFKDFLALHRQVECDIYSLGSPVPAKFRQVLALGWSRLEFLSDGTYQLFISFSNMSGTEIKALRRGKITTRILRAPGDNPLLQGAFLSLFKFGELGPLEIFFNPALYPRGTWKEKAEQSRRTNTLSVFSADTRSWVWTAFRMATMSVKWREALESWWGYLESRADTPPFRGSAGSHELTRGEILSAVDSWKAPFDAQGLEELWQKGENTGVFREEI